MITTTTQPSSCRPEAATAGPHEGRTSRYQSQSNFCTLNPKAFALILAYLSNQDLCNLRGTCGMILGKNPALMPDGTNPALMPDGTVVDSYLHRVRNAFRSRLCINGPNGPLAVPVPLPLEASSDNPTEKAWDVPFLDLVNGALPSTLFEFEPCESGSLNFSCKSERLDSSTVIPFFTAALLGEVYTPKQIEDIITACVHNCSPWIRDPNLLLQILKLAKHPNEATLLVWHDHYITAEMIERALSCKTLSERDLAALFFGMARGPSRVTGISYDSLTINQQLQFAEQILKDYPAVIGIIKEYNPNLLYPLGMCCRSPVVVSQVLEEASKDVLISIFWKCQDLQLRSQVQKILSERGESSIHSQGRQLLHTAYAFQSALRCTDGWYHLEKGILAGNETVRAGVRSLPLINRSRVATDALSLVANIAWMYVKYRFITMLALTALHMLYDDEPTQSDPQQTLLNR